MCGNPDFDPNTFNTVTDVSTFTNAASQVPYEPGSVFKPLTMAAAINEGKVTPESTYTDTGSVKVGSFTIKNSDNKAHGVSTMNQVLEESLNTGAIYSMQQIGPKLFETYIKNFGFGTKTGFGLSESAGNISALAGGKEIYAMTGSFGQGLTVSTLQLANAYAAIANGGKLMKPYVIDEIRYPDGTKKKTDPSVVRDVISPKTASTVSAMLVNVVEKGHGKKAGVNGYYVAGKTGTAQIPDPNGSGYLEGVTIGTFAGFAPVEDPVFAMVVRVDRPKDVQFAESSAAPLFGKIAKFLLSHYHVTPTR
jgi:cell division protein FtsI/penicillin-binding protein 2